MTPASRQHEAGGWFFAGALLSILASAGPGCNASSDGADFETGSGGADTTSSSGPNTSSTSAGGSGVGGGADAGGAGPGGMAGSATGGVGGSAAGAGGAPGVGGVAGDGGGPVVPELCAGDGDCEPFDLVCDPLPRECVECLFDEDCDAGLCHDRTCVAADSCVNSLDCEALEAPICDVELGQCVECLTAADCGDAHDCADQRCVAYTPCENSLDCPEATVCGAESGRCVQCERDADCAEGQVCSANSCRVACDTDRICTELGLLCDFDVGHCVACTDDSVCPGVYHCTQGACQLDLCLPGSQRCSGSSLLTCRDRGDGYDAAACASGQTCVVEGQEASCQDWVCAAGETVCDEAGLELITCSEDGLSIEQSVACDSMGQVCFQGACVELECVPSATYCDAGSIRSCSADGLSSTLVATCSSNHVPTPSCTGAVCDGACEAGFMDCNTDKLTDGCEIDTATNVEQCGGCGAPCSANHMQTRSCSDGACGGSCVDGYDDCNDDLRSDGCETNLLSAPDHCGACDAACENDEVCVGGECGTCNNTVLWLKDSGIADTASVETALEAAGLVVTSIASGVIYYTGTPAAADFGAILLSPGNSYATDMPAAGQTAIVAANADGVGVVMTAWAGYHVSQLRWTTLNPLVLIRYVTGSSAGSSFTLTEADHPIWDGLPTTFSTIGVGIESGTLQNGGVAMATCAACGPTGVAVRETDGRIVQIAHAGNYNTVSWHTDENLLAMFVNAAKWATGCF